MNTLLKTISIISIVSICGLSFFNWMWCDDFQFESWLQSLEILEVMWNMYNNWDGRALSIFTFLQMLSIKLLPHKVTVLIWTFVYILFVGALIKLQKEIKLNLITIGFISVVFFYGFFIHISETVYWAVGGIYILMALFGILWLILVNQVFEYQKNIAAFYIISFVTFISTPNLTIPLFSYVIINIIIDMINRNKKNYLHFIYLFFILLFSITIIVVSPGTQIRTQQAGFSIDFLQLLKNLYGIIIRYFYYSRYIILLAILSNLILYSFKIENNRKTNDRLLANLLYHAKWLLIAFSSVLPLVFVPNDASARTALFFMIFIFLFTNHIVSLILNYLELKLNMRILNLLILSAFIIHLVVITNHYSVAYNINNQMNLRDNYLTSVNKSDTIFVEPLKFSEIPFSLNIEKYELTASSDSWINNEWEAYYKIKTIILKDTINQKTTLENNR